MAIIIVIRIILSEAKAGPAVFSAFSWRSGLTQKISLTLHDQNIVNQKPPIPKPPSSFCY